MTTKLWTGEWWPGRKVLITGHTGFKGAWLCMLLHHLGAKVTGFSLPPPTQPNLFELARLNEIVTTIPGDVRDLKSLQSAVTETGAQIVIHMAAQSLVRESYRDPVGTYATNVMGTVNLLEAVRQAGDQVRAILIVTTDKCYENKEWIWSYRENEPLGGHDPYSSSKACAELVTAAYRASFFSKTKTAVATARAGNVIGGGDWAVDRLIPDVMRAFIAGKPAIIRNPKSIRPWQFVLEPLVGYLTLAERLVEDGQRCAGPFNFGPTEADAKSVVWIVGQLAQRWGNSASWKLADGQHPHEANYLKLDAAKAVSLLNWKPRTDLSTALSWIVDWHRAVQKGEDARRVSGRQILAFMALQSGLCPPVGGAYPTQ